MTVLAFLLRPPATREWLVGFGAAATAWLVTAAVSGDQGLGLLVGAAAATLAFGVIWLKVNRAYEPAPTTAGLSRRPGGTAFWQRRASLLENVVTLGAVVGTFWITDRLGLGTFAVGAAVLAAGLVTIGVFTWIEGRRQD